jgi:glycerol-3-phosphate acyltransferase PlsX
MAEPSAPGPSSDSVPAAPGGSVRGVVRVAVDAAGGDHAPGEVVKGALQAAGGNIAVILVGAAVELGELVGGPLPSVSIVDAPEKIGTDEEPVRAVRGKPRSSLVVAAKLVGDGDADAVVSAGSTGAVLAAALLHVHRLRGIARPAICAVLPAAGGPVVFLDAGANAEVRPEHLRQFAIMGQAFASRVLGIADPQVGLLSIGEEPGKGTSAVIETHRLLAGDARIRFYGNVEGRDLMNRRVDVVISDGFTGNVALKTMEGTGRAILGAVKEVVTSSARARLGGLLLRRDLGRLRDKLDPEEYGGTYLLGMKRPVVIAHGNSHARGIANAVRVAARGAEEGLLDRIAADLEAASDADTSV